MTNNSKIDIHGITDSSVKVKVMQILGKSYEYNELLDQLKTQQEIFDLLPENKQERRLEISAKINELENRIKQFKEDVLRLAEQFKQSEASLIVFALDCVNNSSANMYLSKGLSRELINGFSTISNLKVVAQTSGFKVQEENLTNFDIGKAINVKAFLDGTIRQTDNYLKISVKLIITSDGHCSWAEEYEFKEDDDELLLLQGKIIAKVAQVLNVKQPNIKLLHPQTKNLNVWKLGLEGREFFQKHTYNDWKKAIECFDKAIEIDPNYVDAYVGLSDVLAFPWYFGVIHSNKVIPKWKRANEKSLELGNHLAETHIAVGRFKFFYEWNWEETEKEFKKAIDINSANADAHQQYALFLSAVGRVDEAEKEAKEALKYDPFSLLVRHNVGWVYWYINKTDVAEDIAEKLIKTEHTFYGGYFLLGAVYLAKKEYDFAIEKLEKSISLNFDCTVYSVLGKIYGLTGRQDKALEVLKQLIKIRKTFVSKNEGFYVAAIDIARVFDAIGDFDTSIKWLEEAYQERNGQMVYFKIILETYDDVLWTKDLFNTPQFKDILKRMKFP